MIESLYRTGALRVIQGLSRQYELRSGMEQRGHLRRVRKAKYVVLTYHRVGTRGIPLYCTLSRWLFEEQMRYLAGNCRVISVRQMVAELEKPQNSGQAVSITFDDGYLGTYREAYPILRKYNLPATVYLPAAAIETGNILWYDRIFLGFQKAPSKLTVDLNRPQTYALATFAERIEAATAVVTYLRSRPDGERQQWCKDFESRVPLSASDTCGAMVTWEQVREMQRGGVDFGAHTMTHPVVSRLHPEELRREVAESKWLIEQRLRAPIETFAFPFGKALDCGEGVSQVLATYGFRSAMTSILGVNEPGVDLFRIRRLGIGNYPTVAGFAFQLQRMFFSPIDEEAYASQPRRPAEVIPCEIT